MSKGEFVHVPLTYISCESFSQLFDNCSPYHLHGHVIGTAAVSKVASSGTHGLGARQLANAAAKQAAPSDCFASAVVKPLCIPKELWRLADALVADNGAMLRVPGIFTQRGDSTTLADVLEALDTGAAFEFGAGACFKMMTVTFIYVRIPLTVF